MIIIKYRFIAIVLSILFLLLSVFSVSKLEDKTQNNNVSTKDQTAYYMKGIWVSYITLDMQDTDKSEKSFTNKIKSIVNKTKESGFNTLIIQVRPFGDALYKSRYFPWSHILTGTQGENPKYDPLRIITDICHKNNIKVHAWINPYRVKTEHSPAKLCDSNPYVIDKSIGFTHKGAIYLDPSNEKARKLIANGVKEIVRNYDVDGIQFDDYFYPENADNVDENQYNNYKESTEKPLSKEEWRMKNVNTLIKEVYTTIHKCKDNVVFGISPQGNLNNNKALGADIKTWCEKEGYIDYIAPQIYFSLDNPKLTFEDCLSEWIKLEKHSKLSMYIGLAGYKASSTYDEGTWQDSDDILKTEIEICEEKKLDGIMLYSYESFLSEENKAEIENVVKHITNVTQ